MNKSAGSNPGGRGVDRDRWAFSESGPWILDPTEIRWSNGLVALRESVKAEVPILIRNRFAPPLGRCLSAGGRVGWALVAWKLRESRSEGPVSRAALARRLREAFESLGPAYIKVGQILSTGASFLPQEVVDEFKRCRDEVAPEPFDVIKSVIEEDLGRPLEEVFSSFDRDSLAAASIAQVHAATLITGERVVVKVQRARVSESVHHDIAAMAWIARKLVGRIPAAALANLPALVEFFAETILEEMDFRLEAENMLDIAKVLRDGGQTIIVVPRPHPELVTRRVLVMERLEGFNCVDIEAIERAGIDTEEVLASLMIAFFEGALIYGVFHGDIHGGNFLIMPDGRVALLDYGITGRLQEKERIAFLRMGMLANDRRGQLEAFRDLGAFGDDIDIDELMRVLNVEQPDTDRKDSTKMSPQEVTSGMQETLNELLALGGRLPKPLMLYLKDMIFFDSATAELAPDINVFNHITRIFGYLAQRHGATIAEQIGVEPALNPFDLTRLKESMGLDEEAAEALTHRDLVAQRKEMIEKMRRSKT